MHRVLTPAFEYCSDEAHVDIEYLCADSSNYRLEGVSVPAQSRVTIPLLLRVAII